MRESNLKSHLPVVIITSYNYHPPSYNYGIILHGKNDNSRDPAGSRCCNCQDTNRNSRGSKGILISGAQDRKQHLLLYSPLHSLCFYLTTAFSPFHPPVHSVRPLPPSPPRIRCTRVCTCLGGTSSRSRISPFLSLPQFSPTSLLFSGKGKRARELGTPCLQASSPRVVSLISICRLFVSFTFLFLFLFPFLFLSLSPFFLRSRPPPSRSALVYLYLIFCSWVLDVKTDI